MSESGRGPARWRVVAREPVADARVFRVVRLRSIREGGQGRAEADFFAIDSADFVNVVALTEDDRLIFVEQHRHASGELTLEIPGGLVDAGEDPVAAGLRELEEETGYVAKQARVLGTTRPNPAIMSNRLTTVLAIGARPVAAQSLDEHEDCEVHLLAWDEVLARIDDGRIDHALILASLLFEMRRRAGISASAS